MSKNIKQKTFKPCCNEFKKLTIQYVDLVVPEDESLRMFAELLMRANDDEPFIGRDLRSFAHEIEQYLNRKIVREHHMFNRSLHSCTFPEADLKSEFVRVSEKLKHD